MKKLLKVAVALCVVLSLSISAFAASPTYTTNVAGGVSESGTAVEVESKAIPNSALPSGSKLADIVSSIVGSVSAEIQSKLQEAGIDVNDLGSDRAPMIGAFDVSANVGPDEKWSLRTYVGNVAGFVAYYHDGPHKDFGVVEVGADGYALLPMTGASPVYIYALGEETGGSTPGGSGTSAPAGTGSSTGAGSASSGSPTAPKTGDMTMLYAGVVIMLASAAAVVVYRKKA